MKRVILMFLCVLLISLTGCWDYEEVFDSCIERNPNHPTYCECLAIYNDGLIDLSYEDECWEYRLMNETVVFNDKEGDKSE